MTNKIKLDKEVIRELATLLQENSLTEIEWTQGNQTIRLARQTDTRSISRDFSLKPDATPATTTTKNRAVYTGICTAKRLHSQPDRETLRGCSGRHIQGKGLVL